MISKKLKVILASQSPRRKELLKSIVPQFRIKLMNVEEVYPETLKAESVPEYLAKLKAKPFENGCEEGEVVITADTVVTLDDKIYGKPTDLADATRILTELSGKQHKVITGVCLTSKDKQESFSVTTLVTFKELTPEEIYYYIEEYQPFDKAGAYAIQEWIGMVAIDKMEGDYFNVVGLPVNALYKVLEQY